VRSTNVAQVLTGVEKLYRNSDGTPPRVSVTDVVSAITGKDARHSAELRVARERVGGAGVGWGRGAPQAPPWGAPKARPGHERR